MLGWGFVFGGVGLEYGFVFVGVGLPGSPWLATTPASHPVTAPWGCERVYVCMCVCMRVGVYVFGERV